MDGRRERSGGVYALNFTLEESTWRGKRVALLDARAVMKKFFCQETRIDGYELLMACFTDRDMIDGWHFIRRNENARRSVGSL